MSGGSKLNASLLVLLPLLSGCMGIGFVRSRTTRFDDMERYFQNMPGTSPRAAATLQQHWGEPREKLALNDGRETWIYGHDLRWSGVMLYLLLPIPLLVPVGRETTSVDFENGQAVSVSRVEESEICYICGFLPGPCTSFGCGVRGE